MINKVVYYSVTGNTKKVAQAISETAGCSAETLEAVDLTKPIDVMFVGAAVYATHDHDFHPELKRFLVGLKGKPIKKFAIFGTYAFKSSIVKLASFMQMQGLPLDQHYFVCKGKFLFFNRKNPTEKDLQAAREFAQGQISAV